MAPTPLLDAAIGSSAGEDASERRPGSITHLPLRARRDLLERIVEPQHRRLELVRHERIEDTSTEVRLERLMTAFDDALVVSRKKKATERQRVEPTGVGSHSTQSPRSHTTTNKNRTRRRACS